MGLLFAAIGLVLGAATGYAALRVLARAEPRDPVAQAELDRAVASVDRELAANLELTTMYDQTRQAFVLENGQFEAHRSVLEREVPAAYRQVAALYERIPEAEMAMERRGPAGSIPGPDRETVQAWEGDAREAQRALRSAAVERPASPLRRLLARLRV